MRRISALIVLFLAACAPAAPAGPKIDTRWNADGRTLVVRVRDRAPLADAVLVLAGGTRIAATRIHTHATPPDRPAVGVGAAGGSSSGMGTGVIFSVPFDWLSGGAELPPAESFAEFALAGPAAEAASAGGRIELVFGRLSDAKRRVETPLPPR